MYILCLRVRSANSIPFETTAILGSFDTSMIFKSGMDAVGSKQQRCFVHAQNSPSTDVHGRTTVEDGSNGLTVSIFPRFLSILPDAFPLC